MNYYARVLAANEVVGVGAERRLHIGQPDSYEVFKSHSVACFCGPAERTAKSILREAVCSHDPATPQPLLQLCVVTRIIKIEQTTYIIVTAGKDRHEHQLRQ